MMRGVQWVRLGVLFSASRTWVRFPPPPEEKKMWKILLYCFGLYALVCGLSIICVSRRMQKEVDEIMDAVQITHEEDE